MSRPAAPGSGQPPTSHTLAQLQSLLGIENESTTDRSPKDWFERALRESELAILAERKQRKEDMFLCYTKACHFYVNTKMHPDFAAVRKGDPNWGTRVKDFREVRRCSGRGRVGDRGMKADICVDVRGLLDQSQGAQGGSEAKRH